MNNADPRTMAALGNLPSVLIVEGGEPSASVEGRLSHSGYRVVTVPDGQSALRALPDLHPDLVLLEVAARDPAKWETLALIRRSTDSPLLLVSEGDSELERVRGLRGGADDVVGTQTSRAELTARVAALLRRARRREEGFDDGVVRIDRAHADVSVRGEAVRLTPAELKLLEALTSAAGRVLSADELLDLVWGWTPIGGHERVRMYVGYLRSKIGGGLVETVRGQGYRYVMAPGGIEPPRAASKAAALSAELRGRADEG